jgi:hypothetical protein
MTADGTNEDRLLDIASQRFAHFCKAVDAEALVFAGDRHGSFVWECSQTDGELHRYLTFALTPEQIEDGGQQMPPSEASSYAASTSVVVDDDRRFMNEVVRRWNYESTDVGIADIEHGQFERELRVAWAYAKTITDRNLVDRYPVRS